MSLPIAAPNTPISRLILRPAVRVEGADTIAEAAAKMRTANVSSALVGPGRAIVTERDLTVAWAEGRSGDEPVSEIASPDPLVVSAGMSICEAAATMLNHEIRHLIVVRGDDPPGVVSLRSVMAALLQSASPEAWLTTLRISFNQPAELWLG